MELEEYQAMFELEDSFWWYTGQRKMAAAMLSGQKLDPKTTKILDAGCGTGANLLFLQQYGKVTGIDLSTEALNFCKVRGLDNVLESSITELPFADNSFDLVTSFDVIYHMAVNDDLLALKEMARVLRPGGLLLIRVPAYDKLRGNHDIAVHTRHRYTAMELGAKLTAAGLTIEKLTYANTLLFPLLAVKRMAETKLPSKGNTKSDVRPIASWMNSLLLNVLTFEAGLLRKANMPFGLSVCCLARKP